MKTFINIFIVTFIIMTFQIKAQGLIGPIDPFAEYEYRSSTIVLSSINATFITFNTIRILKKDKAKSNAAFGILFGAFQTGYGILNSNSREENSGACTPINIGLGLTTIVTSVVRLAKKSPPDNKTAFNLFFYPQTNSVALGFNFKRRLN